MSVPILIYVSKRTCPACRTFEKQWDCIRKTLANKVRFVKFDCDVTKSLVPPCLKAHVQWFPTVLLVGPNSYFKCFTPDDKINSVDWCDNYTMKAYKYNLDPRTNGYASLPNTCNSVVNWVHQTMKILQDDESLPKMKL